MKFLIASGVLAGTVAGLWILAVPAALAHPCIEHPSPDNCLAIHGNSQELQSPTFTFEEGLAIPGLPDLTAAGPAQVVQWIFYLIMGSVGVLSLIMLVMGGVQFIASSIDPTARSQARNKIQAALTGLLLALTSYILLYTLNPDLVILRNPSLPCVSCDCVDAKNKGERVNVLPGVTEANCVSGDAFPGFSGAKLTDVIGSQDKELINIYREKTAGKTGKDFDNALKEVTIAAHGLGYRAIYSDDKDIVKCMAYCMLENSSGKSDNCGYIGYAGVPEECRATWDTFTKKNDRTVPSGVDWRCRDGNTEVSDWTDVGTFHGGGTMILDFFKTKALCISSASCGKLAIGCTDADNPNDDEVLACPLFSTYVSKAIQLYDSGDDWVLCKCATNFTCIKQDEILGL